MGDWGNGKRGWELGIGDWELGIWKRGNGVGDWEREKEKATGKRAIVGMSHGHRA